MTASTAERGTNVPPQQVPAPRSDGRADQRRLAVIDIGSNSIRLVVFEGLRRAPLPLFNEKVICGLGRGLMQSGRLSEDGVQLALPNLARFSLMARAMGADRLDLLATAAVREAENGPDFIAEVERRCGQAVRVLSGEEEARISALGVLAGTPEADGVMGDLGGGSLELVELTEGKLGASATLSLGPLRLIDLADGDLAAARAEIDRQLAAIGWLAQQRGRSFYAVGGAWRALARIHMSQVNYPLHVIHGYELKRPEAEKTLDVLGQLGRRSLAKMTSVTRRRVETIPYAALLLSRVLALARPDRVFWSSFGLREGFLFDLLPDEERAKDPLIETVIDFARREGRFGEIGDDLSAWTEPLFADEKQPWRRLREATCHLSDIAWREHPDYRATHALTRILHHPFSGVDHPGRAFMAFAVFTRYGGSGEDGDVDKAAVLITGKNRKRARVLGLAVRLAYTLSAGTRELLHKTALELDEDALRLRLPGDGSVPQGEAVERRFAALAAAIGVKQSEIVGG
jgi:exopolyphosphatase/guanosine-5'-triphosphate,3'-diphosphate pyrophosphatase